MADEWKNVGKIKGDKGDKGEKGSVGATGEKGATGAKGDNGIESTGGDDIGDYVRLADGTQLVSMRIEVDLGKDLASSSISGMYYESLGYFDFPINFVSTPVCTVSVYGSNVLFGKQHAVKNSGYHPRVYTSSENVTTCIIYITAMGRWK